MCVHKYIYIYIYIFFFFTSIPLGIWEVTHQEKKKKLYVLIHWSPDVNCQLIGKDPDARKD